MEILVTGATGFMGTSLCRQLTAAGHRVVGLGSRQCDLTQDGSLHQFDDARYDQIYHLAAWTQAGDFCLSHPGEQWIINQQINTNVLAWWRRSQPQARLICMGTSCAYPTDRALEESQFLSGLPTESLFTYGMTKRMLYVGLLALQKQFGLQYLCLVPSTLYGPGYHTDGRQMHFIFDLIRKIIRGKLYGEPVVLWGDGRQSRELVYVDDFTRIAMQLADRAPNEIVNIGAGEEHAIRDFAQMICQRVGYDFGRIEFDQSKYVGARSKCLAVGKLRTLLPELSLTPLDVGLTRTIEWFWQEQEKLTPAPRAA